MTLADCVWTELGGFISAHGWHQGPMTWQQVDALLALADTNSPASPHYGQPDTWDDDYWVLSNGEWISTRTRDYTEVVYINSAGDRSAEAMIAVYQDRVIVVGFLHDNNPDPAWHCLCGAYGIRED